MLRPETRARARALQLLYAAELSGEPLAGAVRGLARLTRSADGLEAAEAMAAGVQADRAQLDRLIADAADNWRLDRIGIVERNILRLGIHELRQGATSPKVVIDEAVRLGHWFGGPRSPGFVNGVLDRVARTLGLL